MIGWSSQKSSQVKVAVHFCAAQTTWDSEQNLFKHKMTEIYLEFAKIPTYRVCIFIELGKGLNK